MLIRDAAESDLPAILEIYNEVIANTTAVYSEMPVTLDNRRSWRQARLDQGYPVLVAEEQDGIAGFASFGDFRPWPCYRHSVELSVHVHAMRRGRGIGKHLVKALFPRAALCGKHVIIAGIDAGNAASLAMHEQLGFTRAAHLREVGRKFDRWLDLVLMQRFIG